MATCYFNLRDNEPFFADKEGTRLAGGINTARIEALATLTEYAKELKPSVDRRCVTVEVRDEHGTPLLRPCCDEIPER
jgi:hypothetical protein